MLDLDEEFNELPDVKDRIRLLAKYIEKNFGGTHYEGPADITPLN